MQSLDEHIMYNEIILKYFCMSTGIGNAFLFAACDITRINPNEGPGLTMPM